MNRKIFILSIVFVSIANLHAQTDSIFSLSLKEAQEYALQNNRNIRASQIDLEIAKKKIWETTAIGLPQFSITGNYQHIFEVPEFSFPVSGYTQDPLVLSEPVEGFNQFQTIGGLNQYAYEGPGFPVAEKDNATFDFTLRQLIFSGEYLVGLQASKVYKQLSEQSLFKSKNDIKESIANSYHLVLILDRNVDILKESFAVVSKTQFEMNQMYQQGFIEETDADRLTVITGQLQNTISTLEGQSEVSKRLLKMQLGMDLNNTIVLTDSIEGLIVKTNLRVMDSTSFDINSNINYQLVNTVTDLSKLNLKRQKSLFLPSFAAFYNHQELAKEPVLNFQPKDVLGVSMSFPLFSSGQRISTVSQAHLAYEKALLAQMDAEQGLIIQYETAKNDYFTAYETYLTSENNLRLTRRIFDKSVISFREGVGSSLELTQNQREFLTAESQYLNAIVALLNAKAKLDNLLNQNVN